MKSVTLLLLLSSLNLVSIGQSVFSNQTNAALQKVIGDYPNRFINIKGAALHERQRSVEYNSTVQIPGAQNCVITEFTENTAPTYSWSCRLFATNSFQQARDRYQELYNQIRNTIIRIEGEKPSILNGQYEMPLADSRQTVTRFGFLPAPESIQQLKVELLLVYNDDWTIWLKVNDHESELFLTGQLAP